jgi:hypothetical protein
MPSARTTSLVRVLKTRYRNRFSLYGRMRSRIIGPTCAYATSASARLCSGSSTGSEWIPSPVSVLFSILTVRVPPIVSTNTWPRIDRCGCRPSTWSSRVTSVQVKSCDGGNTWSRSPRLSM